MESILVGVLSIIFLFFFLKFIFSSTKSEKGVNLDSFNMEKNINESLQQQNEFFKNIPDSNSHKKNFKKIFDAVYYDKTSNEELSSKNLETKVELIEVLEKELLVRTIEYIKKTPFKNTPIEGIQTISFLKSYLIQLEEDLKESREFNLSDSEVDFIIREAYINVYNKIIT